MNIDSITLALPTSQSGARKVTMANTVGQTPQRPQIQRTPIESDRDIQRNRFIRWVELFLWALLLIGGSTFLGAFLLAMPLNILLPQVSWSFILGWMGAGLGAEMFS